MNKKLDQHQCIYKEDRILLYMKRYDPRGIQPEEKAVLLMRVGELKAKLKF